MAIFKCAHALYQSQIFGKEFRTISPAHEGEVHTNKECRRNHTITALPSRKRASERRTTSEIGVSTHGYGVCECKWIAVGVQTSNDTLSIIALVPVDEVGRWVDTVPVVDETDFAGIGAVALEEERYRELRRALVFEPVAHERNLQQRRMVHGLDKLSC